MFYIEGFLVLVWEVEFKSGVTVIGRKYDGIKVGFYLEGFKELNSYLRMKVNV